LILSGLAFDLNDLNHKNGGMYQMDIKVGDLVKLTEDAKKIRITAMGEWTGVVIADLGSHFRVKWPRQKDVSHNFTSFLDRTWTERKENLKKVVD
jgi:hypothetical protein